MTIDPNNLANTATVTFDDEFNTLSLWNGTAGTWSTTFWYDNPTGNGSTLSGNGEQQWYINSLYAPTASVTPWKVDASGILHLTAAPASADISALIGGYKFTSGEVNTFHSFSQTYGYFEMKAKLPAGQGLWPAFWLLPEDGSWPPELDVMEMLGNATSTIYTTVHSNALGAGVGQEAQANTVADTSAAFHTYGMDWEADYITWYFDGKAIYKVATPTDMNKPMYMVANLAVGGYWPGNANSATPFPADMQIDYIRAYKAGPVTTPGLTLTATSAGSMLNGGAGNDLFYASQGNDVLTGGAGADTFVFQKQPWAPAHITDFVVGTDKLDLSAMLSAYGYTGTDPIKDGWIFLYGDGAGGTIVRFNDHAPGRVWPNTIIDLEHVSPTGLTWAQLSASPGSTPTPPVPPVTTPVPPVDGAGHTFTATSAGAILAGGAGNDTFYASQGNDVLTGGGGSDTFVFQKQPWAPHHITDFTPGTDKLDLSAMLKAYGYTGTDPIKDGWIFLYGDGAGGTIVRFNDHAPGTVWPNTIIDLDHLSPTGLTWSGLTGGGASQPTTSSSILPPATSGVTLTATGPDQTLVGGAGDDCLTGGAGNDILTGGAGANTFKFVSEPWAPNTVTDFKPGTDKLDFSGLLKAYGYTGTDPIHDGWLSVYADGAGGSIIRFNDHLPGVVWPNTILDLQHVLPGQVSMSDWILH